MYIFLYEGYIGSGKTLFLAKKTQSLIARNRAIFARNEKWYLDGRIPERIPLRKIASNIKFSKDFENENKDIITYWNTERELLQITDCDIIWDEMQVILDAHLKTDISQAMRQFLAYLRKNGNVIYATSQSYYHITKRARQYIYTAIKFRKMFGSPTPTPTNPFPKVYGLILGFNREVSPMQLDDTITEKFSIFPTELFFIQRKDVELYDTTEKYKVSDHTILRHVKVECECGGLVCGHKPKFVWYS